MHANRKPHNNRHSQHVGCSTGSCKQARKLGGMALSAVELSSMALSGMALSAIELSGVTLGGMALNAVELSGMKLSGMVTNMIKSKASQLTWGCLCA